MKVVILSCLLATVLGLAIDEVITAFDDLDHNGDGVVLPYEVLVRFEQIDANNDGNITLQECSASAPFGTPKSVIKANCNYLDKIDGAADGLISPSVVVGLFDILDVNGDGVVTFKEFKKRLPQIRDGVKDEMNDSSED